MERVTRKDDDNFAGMDWIPFGWVRLTNHGDGTAHDVELIGERCGPRVWIGDSGAKPHGGQLVEADFPLWRFMLATSVGRYAVRALSRPWSSAIGECTTQVEAQ